MTCICWDGQRLAADTLLTQGSRKLQGDYQKIYLPGEMNWTINGMPVIAIGIAGNANTLSSIIQRLLEGVVYEMDPKVNNQSFQLLLVTDTKVVWYWNYGLTSNKESVNELFVIHGNHAIGSGTPYGLGIMGIKGTAVDGVRGAMKVDLHTGGFIDVWNFDTPKEVARIQPTPLTDEEAIAHEASGGFIVEG